MTISSSPDGTLSIEARVSRIRTVVNDAANHSQILEMLRDKLMLPVEVATKLNTLRRDKDRWADWENWDNWDDFSDIGDRPDWFVPSWSPEE